MPDQTPPLRYFALATASAHSDIIGTVAFSFESWGLRIELLNVRRFQSGYVPGENIRTSELRIPFTAIRNVTQKGTGLLLSLDPIFSPIYKKFHLIQFSTESGAWKLSPPRRWILSATTAISIGIFWGFRWEPHSLWKAILLSGLLSLPMFLLFTEIRRRITFAHDVSVATRNQFEQCLLKHMGLAPQATPFFRASTVSSREIIIRALLTATFIVFSVATARSVHLNRPTAHTCRTGISRETQSEDQSSCICSPPPLSFATNGIDRLSILFAQSPSNGSNLVEPHRRRYRFDVIVVNNTSHPLTNVQLHFMFYRKQKTKATTVDRGFFWEGDLNPASAAKWRVSAPGEQFSVTSNYGGKLTKEDSIAGADAIRSLLKSKFRIVQLHAVELMAFTHDAETDKALDSLELPFDRAISPTHLAIEKQRIQEIRNHRRPLLSCAFQSSDSYLEFCAFNTTNQPVWEFSVIDPQWQQNIKDLLMPHSGKMQSIHPPHWLHEVELAP